MSTDLRPVWRVPLLALGMLSLAFGIGAGLLRLGWPLQWVSPAASLHHAAWMIGGFFGTVIGLERAVALRVNWGYAAPLLSGLGGIVLATGLNRGMAAVMIGAGSAVLVGVSLLGYLRQRALHTATMLLGAAALLGGNIGWFANASAHSISTAVSLWIVFLVLTIAGERLELSRFLPPSPTARKLFIVIVTGLLVGPALFPFDTGIAAFVLGVSLLALALWLFKQDVARRTVRQAGLTRFIAIALLAGYAWLAFGALVMLRSGLEPGMPGYDVALHSILLGFVFSMVLGHAPIIFPAVLSVRLPYSRWFYGPLALLHGSLALRVAGPLAGEAAWRSAGGMLNAVAIGAFVLAMVSAIAVGRAGPAAGRGRSSS